MYGLCGTCERSEYCSKTDCLTDWRLWSCGEQEKLCLDCTLHDISFLSHKIMLGYTDTRTHSKQQQQQQHKSKRTDEQTNERRNEQTKQHNQQKSPKNTHTRRHENEPDSYTNTHARANTSANMTDVSCVIPLWSYTHSNKRIPWQCAILNSFGRSLRIEWLRICCHTFDRCVYRSVWYFCDLICPSVPCESILLCPKSKVTFEFKLRASKGLEKYFFGWSSMSNFMWKYLLLFEIRVVLWAVKSKFFVFCDVKICWAKNLH